jgi:archaellum biogenesis ATPase FlaH
MIDEFDFSVEIQDQIICLMAENTKFLEQCVRRNVKAEYFSSEVRQVIVSIITGYYTEYVCCPGFDRLQQLIVDEASNGKKIKEEDIESYSHIWETITLLRKATTNYDWILDRMDSFIKKRVVYRLTERLSNFRDRLGVDPDLPLEAIREALGEVDSKTGRQVIESILDEEKEKPRSEIVGKMNIADIDSAMGGGFTVGSFVVVLGYTNIGKSWCAAHIAKIATRLGESPLLIDLERSNKQVRLRINMSFSGKTKEEVLRDSRETRSIVRTSLVKKSTVILINDEEKSMSVSGIPSILDSITDKYGIRPRLIILDSADDLAPPQGVKLRDKLDRTTAIYTWLKNYAKEVENDVCVITTAQAQRRAEKAWWIGSGHIGDDINKIRKATVGISINGLPHEIKQGYSRLWVFKNTDGPVGTRVWVKNNFGTGQFMTDWGKFDMRVYKEMVGEAD